MPLCPTNLVRNMPLSLSTPSTERYNNASLMDRVFSPDLPSPEASWSLRRPPLPPSNFKTRPLSKIAIIRPNNTKKMISRSPSPALSSSSRCAPSSVCYPSSSSRSSMSSINSFCPSPTPRRMFPQEQYCDSEIDELSSKEQAPVVFDASLNFILGIEKQKVRQSFRPTASHLEPQTASSLLSSKISQFLKRTDHIMEEWKRLGHKDESSIDSMGMPYDKYGRIGRSKSVTNIMIKGFQYYSRASSVARSISDSTRMERLSEDRTLSECDDNEVSN